MADSAPISDFKWALVPGLFWGFLIGALAGTFVGLFVTSGLGADISASREHRLSLEQKCIDGNDGACRVLEVRR